jgi:two-component system heavy metal sensor histidine kinase CusS
MTALRALLARWCAPLRCSMTAQIWLSITLMATLLVAGSSTLVLGLSKQGLGDVADVILLANLASIQQELTDEHLLDRGAAESLANRIESQLGNLHVALLDEHRQLIAASEQYGVPLSLLPAQAFSAVLLPRRITTDKVRLLARQLDDGVPEGGPQLTHNVDTPDGRSYRLLLGSLALPAAAPGAPDTVLAVLALDATPARDLARRSWTVIVLALLLSAATAALVGRRLARRIVVTAQRLGGAAARIGAHRLGERLAVAELPLELRDTGDAFNHMLDRLEAAFTRQSELTADMAHDLRTPINNLLGEAQVALSRPRSADEYRGVLESAVEDYERLARLIENMLFLARTDDTQARLQREWVDAPAFCARVRDYFEPLAEERGLRIACEWQGASALPALIWADRSLLIRAVANLLDNALRYAAGGTQVTLTICVSARGAARVDVANAGPAIPEAFHRRVFERMFRLDPARERSADGSGLGLAIVKSVMDLHGGSVSLRSAAGEHTVFTLWFPAAIEAGAAHA